MGSFIWKLFFALFFLHVMSVSFQSVSMCVCMTTYAPWHKYGDWNTFLSFYHIGFDDQTQISRFGSKLPDPLSRVPSPLCLFFE